MAKSLSLGLISLLATLVALEPFSVAQACSCAAINNSQLLDRASVVFTGVATTRADPNAGAQVKSSLDPITWSFQVDSVAKGQATNPEQIVTARDGASCGMGFALGTRYLVYARQVSDHLETDLCSGTREAGGVSFTPIPAGAVDSGSRDQRSEGRPSLAPVLLDAVMVLVGAFALAQWRGRRSTRR